MPLPFALVGFPIQLNALSVRNAQIMRGWALEAESGARLCEHIGQRQVKATAIADQGRVPLEEFAVTAPANAKREAVFLLVVTHRIILILRHFVAIEL